MKKMIAFATMAVFLAATGAAFAAPKPESARMSQCQTLMKQFDDSLAAHATAPKLATAKQLRSSGQTACDTGKYRKGIHDLHAALREIGVKPVRQKTAAK